MKKHRMDFFVVAIGIILLVTGVFLQRIISDPQGLMKALPYICIGFGSGAFGHGMGNIVTHKAMKADPNVEKQLEINKNDERSITISNRAKAKAYDLMTFVFGALMIIFALMQIDMVAVLLFVFAYLFVQGYSIYYRIKYDKEM